MNLQAKINWFKLNGWLSFSEVEPSTVDLRSFNCMGQVDKVLVGNGYCVAYWTCSGSSNQFEGRGDTQAEAVEELYSHIGEQLWARIATMSNFS